MYLFKLQYKNIIWSITKEYKLLGVRYKTRKRAQYRPSPASQPHTEKKCMTLP